MPWVCFQDGPCVTCHSPVDTRCAIDLAAWQVVQSDLTLELPWQSRHTFIVAVVCQRIALP